MKGFLGLSVLLSLVSGRRQLRSCQLTLLTSLAFVAVLAILSAPLTAQTTQNSRGIPDLRGYDSETRGTIETACSSEYSRGPVAYGACLNRQIASLRRYESETRRKTSPASKSGGTSRNSATAQ
jgi:hypothetical protein